MILRAIAVAILLLGCQLGAASASEVEGCNSEKVKDILLSNTFEKLKESAIKLYSQGNPGPNTPQLMAALDNWSGTIINVRQTKYDAANDTRYCEADFKYQNTPFTILMPLLASDPTCAKAFTYKVEPLLDKPGHIYVSWRCHIY